MTPIKWRKSTRSNSGPGQCVEAGAFNGAPTATASMIAVRDSKWDSSNDFPTLTMPTSDWTGLITSVKAGDFLR